MAERKINQPRLGKNEVRACTERDEELVVMAVIKVLHKVAEYGKFGENLVYLWCSDDLGTRQTLYKVGRL